MIGIDPDGEWVNFLIGAVVGGVGGYSTGKALGKSGWKLFAYTVAGAGIGAATAGIGTAVTAGTSATLGSVGSTLAGGSVAGAFNGAAMAGLGGQNIGQGALYGSIGGLAGSTAGLVNVYGIVPGALYGAGTGGLIAGGINHLRGGSFSDGFKAGAISGGIMGGINGGIAASQSVHDRNILSGYITRDYLDNHLNNFINGQHPSWNHGRNITWKSRAISDNGRTTDQGSTVTIKRSIVKQHLLGRNTNQLYLTAGHESQHVGDFANGNFLRYRNNFLSANPNANHATVSKAITYQSEINAYTWQLNQARILNYRVAHYQNSLNHYQNLYNGL